MTTETLTHVSASVTTGDEWSHTSSGDILSRIASNDASVLIWTAADVPDSDLLSLVTDAPTVAPTGINVIVRASGTSTGSPTIGPVTVKDGAGATVGTSSSSVVTVTETEYVLSVSVSNPSPNIAADWEFEIAVSAEMNTNAVVIESIQIDSVSGGGGGGGGGSSSGGGGGGGSSAAAMLLLM